MVTVMLRMDTVKIRMETVRIRVDTVRIRKDIVRIRMDTVMTRMDTVRIKKYRVRLQYATTKLGPEMSARNIPFSTAIFSIFSLHNTVILLDSLVVFAINFQMSH